MRSCQRMPSSRDDLVALPADVVRLEFVRFSIRHEAKCQVQLPILQFVEQQGRDLHGKPEGDRVLALCIARHDWQECGLQQSRNDTDADLAGRGGLCREAAAQYRVTVINAYQNV